MGKSVNSQNSFEVMINTPFEVVLPGEENINSISEESNWKVMIMESDVEVIYKAK